MYSSLFGVVVAGFLSIGAYAHSAQLVGVAGFAPEVESMAARAEPGAAEQAKQAAIVPPSDLENDDSGDYMKDMSPAELEALYAQHDAEVARLMAAAPDHELFGKASLIDPATGEEVSIDLVSF